MSSVCETVMMTGTPFSQPKGILQRFKIIFVSNVTPRFKVLLAKWWHAQFFKVWLLTELFCQTGYRFYQFSSKISPELGVLNGVWRERSRNYVGTEIVTDYATRCEIIASEICTRSHLTN